MNVLRTLFQRFSGEVEPRSTSRRERRRPAFESLEGRAPLSAIARPTTPMIVDESIDVNVPALFETNTETVRIEPRDQIEIETDFDSLLIEETSPSTPPTVVVDLGIKVPSE